LEYLESYRRDKVREFVEVYELSNKC